MEIISKSGIKGHKRNLKLSSLINKNSLYNLRNLSVNANAKIDLEKVLFNKSNSIDQFQEAKSFRKSNKLVITNTINSTKTKTNNSIDAYLFGEMHNIVYSPKNNNDRNQIENFQNLISEIKILKSKVRIFYFNIIFLLISGKRCC
jgi:hypothetical protein